MNGAPVLSTRFTCSREMKMSGGKKTLFLPVYFFISLSEADLFLTILECVISGVAKSVLSVWMYNWFVTLSSENSIDDYAKNVGSRQVWFLCSFYYKPLRTWIETNVNKFAISNHTALKLDGQALRSYLSLICEYELYILPNKKVSTAKDHGKLHGGRTTPVLPSFA